MRYRVINESVSGHCCFEYTVVDTGGSPPVSRGRSICECFNRVSAERVARALNAEEDAVDEDVVDQCVESALAGRTLTLNIPE